MTNHPRSPRQLLLNVKQLPQCTDSAAHGISSKKATEIRYKRKGRSPSATVATKREQEIVECAIIRFYIEHATVNEREHLESYAFTNGLKELELALRAHSTAPVESPLPPCTNEVTTGVGVSEETDTV